MRPPSRAGSVMITAALGLLLVLSLVAGCRERKLARPISDAELVTVVDSSSAVFVGEVLARGARTTTAVPLSDLTAIVKVLEVAPPESLSLLAPNDLVTVRVSDTTSLSENTTYAFVGNVLALDTGVVVGEITRLDASTPELRASAMGRLRVARTAAEDAHLRQHLIDASAVVLGVVGNVAPAARDTTRQSREAEGSSQWQVARIDVRRLWRGDTTAGARQMSFYFQGSRHVRFADAPRPALGDSAIFIAHSAAMRVASGRDSTVMLLLDSFDMLPAADSMRVDRLVTLTGGRTRR